MVATRCRRLPSRPPRRRAPRDRWLEIGDRLRRIPDGETGPRSDWIVWQLPVFTTQQQFEVVPPGLNSWRPLPRVRLAEGARPDDVTFGALGYADAAVASYRVFARLKRDGLVPVACRFQVCLPTPLAPIRPAAGVPEHAVQRA